MLSLRCYEAGVHIVLRHPCSVWNSELRFAFYLPRRIGKHRETGEEGQDFGDFVSVLWLHVTLFLK